MKNTSIIGMGFLEKLFAFLFPVVLGTIGCFFPKLLNFISLFSDSKVIQFMKTVNPFWLSVILLCVGIVVGLLLSLTVYKEALKISINDQELWIKKDDDAKIIKKSEIQGIFMEGNQVIIMGRQGQELLREKTDIKKEEVRKTFQSHDYPWYEEDPYINEFHLWTLDDQILGEKANSILYERRNALREGDKKKAKDLKTDLHELGVVVKDQGENQYVRKIKIETE